MRAYFRSLNPQLSRDVWILQAGGLANMFGNGVIGPFLHRAKSGSADAEP